jgi:hypothetical protein
MDAKLLNISNKLPEYYDWPFFFTIQKHTETRLKQLGMWADIILSYCKANKIWRISKSQFANGIGKNTKVNR